MHGLMGELPKAPTLPIAELERLPGIAHTFPLGDSIAWTLPLPRKVSLANPHATSYLILLLWGSPGWPTEVDFIEWLLCYDLYLIY